MGSDLRSCQETDVDWPLLSSSAAPIRLSDQAVNLPQIECRPGAYSDSRENRVMEAECRISRWNVAAYLCHNLRRISVNQFGNMDDKLLKLTANQSRCSHYGRFPSHIGTSNDHDLFTVVIEFDVIWDKQSVLVERLHLR